RQRQFLADIPTGLVDQGQPVSVRVEYEANVRGVLDDERADVAEVAGHRLRLMLKEAIRVTGVADRPALERFQKPPAERAASAAVGIKERTKATRADADHIHQLQYTIAMPVLGTSAF